MDLSHPAEKVFLPDFDALSPNFDTFFLPTRCIGLDPFSRLSTYAISVISTYSFHSAIYDIIGEVTGTRTNLSNL